MRTKSGDQGPGHGCRASGEAVHLGEGEEGEGECQAIKSRTFTRGEEKNVPT